MSIMHSSASSKTADENIMNIEMDTVVVEIKDGRKSSLNSKGNQNYS